MFRLFRNRWYVAVLSVLGVSACGPAAPNRTEILWDTWGVPHIYGKNNSDVFRAFGWAQMESHGDLILRLYGQARGRAAEYLGEEYLASDRLVRTLGIPRLAEEWYEAQEAEFRSYLDAFAAGMNAYVGEHPDRIADDVEALLPITAVDVLAHGLRVVHFTFVATPGSAGLSNIGPLGSNTWAVAPSRTASDNAMLLANPHLPWSDLFLFYEAHLVGPDLDAYGTALVGTPTLEIAFNDHLGWSHTVNTYDGADAYELTVEGDGYRFDGEVRPFEEETQTIRVRLEDGTTREEALFIRRSVHGPVVRELDGKPIALRVAGIHAAGMWEEWWDMIHATSLAEFEAAVSRLQVPMFTVMYADREGNIMHLFNGRVPVRSGGDFSEWTRVLPGDTSATLWTETHGYDDLPRVLNPASGWLQNANDPPWTTTFPLALNPEDYPPYIAPSGMAFRPQRSARMLFEDEQITWEEFIQYKHSTRSEFADRILDELIGAARQDGGTRVQRAADVLERWDRETNADSRGAVLFLNWIQRVARSPAFFATPWSWEAPRSTPAGISDLPGAVRALETAARDVEGKYGTLDVPWGDVYRLRVGGRDLPANGATGGIGVFRVVGYSPTDDGRFEAASGDSYVALTEFSDPVRARVLLSYGNATQTHSSHVGDQLELFARKKLRPVWRTREEIEANLESLTAFQ